jgi:drug/metabolite transporter (DMT)-like permease
MPWAILFPILCSAALHAGWNALVKAGSNRLMDTVLVVTGAGMVTALAVPFLPLPEPACWHYLAGSVLIHLWYFIATSFAYRAGDFGLVYPLTRGSAPALTALAAVALLDEWPSRGGWAGIALISGGALLLVADSRRGGGVRAAAVGLALANASVIVIYTVVDGAGARLSGQPFSYTAWMLLLTSGLLIALALIVGQRQAVRHLAGRWHIGLLGGGCTFTSYALALWAMTHAPIALVAALRETSIVFGVILAAFVLKERVTRLRCLSILSIAAGAITVKVS